MIHLTWSQVAYDPPGAELPKGIVLPGRPLTFQDAGCYDCDWQARAKTDWEIINERLNHMAHMSVGRIPAAHAIPAMPEERRWVA